MVRNAPDAKTQIRLRINVIEFGRTDQAIDGCRSLSPGIRTSKKIILPTQRHGSQRTFRCIVIDLDPTIASITDERGPKLQGITNRFRQR